ncbi:response regulator [Neptuniibacter halophilus]|uniref:response regulator n=1 Tax=Neptuniibacter halophilus TaxID=651666 RepID=UPI002574491C|nr:response regulator [Neptuniibacter halophilus]
MTDTLLFAAEEPVNSEAGLPPWKVLIVDDEESVHRVTQLVLKNAYFDGRPVELLEARSAAEARALLEQHGSDIGLALIDVVMETDDAGLQLVRTIRQELQNEMTRLVLRTGQPGQAPEERVIHEYDINDYKDKTELTGIKLKTLVYSSLRSYRDIRTIDHQRRSLETVIHAIGQINQVNSLSLLASAILSQLISLLNFEPDAIYCSTRRIYRDLPRFTVLAATGNMKPLLDHHNQQALVQFEENELPEELQTAFGQALAEKRSIHTDQGYIAYHSGMSGAESLLYIKHRSNIDEHGKHLLEIFSADVISTYHTLLLKEEIQETQAELIYILGEAVEKRSKETGAHVKRVAEISALLASAYGTNQVFVENLRLASPLHDLGKIAIPDAILNKPGKLDAEEWQVMQTHAEIGESMLRSSDRPVFQLAARIAGSHHEKWDGSGYPKGLKGEEIPLSGRITAVADVFDALNSARCYKEGWPLEQTLQLLQEQSGKHFDPQLIELFEKNLDSILAICQRYPD